MAREGLLAKTGLILGSLVAVAMFAFVFFGWYLQNKDASAAAQAVADYPSRAGWETRYTATLALARRGSDLVKDRMDILEEMLDEEQQLRNFRAKGKKGQDVPDEAEAFATIANALKSIVELQRRRPDMDLSALYPAVNKVAQTSNRALRDQAEQTKNILTSPKNKEK